jgi:hypothetical protein
MTALHVIGAVVAYFCRTNYQKENNNPEEPNGMIIGVF